MNKLFDFLRPAAMTEDPFFGSLRLIKAANGKSSYWEGMRAFTPLAKSIEIFIDSSPPEQKPSEAQQDFFQKIEREYASVCSAAKARFHGDPWIRSVMREGFEEEFYLSSISIPLCREPNEDWFLTFESGTDDGHTLTVFFRGAESLEISVDG